MNDIKKLETMIENTAAELEANQKLADGYRALAALPENTKLSKWLYNFQADKYRRNEAACAEFLNMLYKSKRGLA